jgi:hypothetical protein
MAMPWVFFCFNFDLVKHVEPICLQFADLFKDISCCLGRQYGPVLSLSFFDVYELTYLWKGGFKLSKARGRKGCELNGVLSPTR